MKILVFGDRLEVGGSQVNAIELTAALRDLHGHDVLYFATPGPMEALVRQKGLRFIAAPDAARHPSPARMRALRRLARAEKPDVVHAWDWWQCLDAYWAVHLAMGIPLVVSDMTMAVGRVLPKSVPTTFGTPALADDARALGRRSVDVLLPPVDVHHNAAGTVDPAAFRTEWGIAPDDVLLVTVSRLAATLKAESLRRTIDAMRLLGHDARIRLVVVGDGPIRNELQQLANQVNSDLRRQAVQLTGPLLDPRPAYAAADVVIGMGGSALRGMAFRKAVLVVGERGFAEAFTPESAERFHYRGMFGLGNGTETVGTLAGEIRALLAYRDGLDALGRFSRAFVERHYSVEAGSLRLSQLFEKARTDAGSMPVAAMDGVRTAAVLAGGALKHAVRWPPRLPPARTPQTAW